MVASLLRLDHARVGLVVPRHGRSAVDRNRLKRRLRELARTELLPGAPAVDAVLHARPGAYALSFDELRATTRRIRTLVERAAPPILESAATDAAADGV